MKRIMNESRRLLRVADALAKPMTKIRLLPRQTRRIVGKSEPDQSRSLTAVENQPLRNFPSESHRLDPSNEPDQSIDEESGPFASQSWTERERHDHVRRELEGQKLQSPREDKTLLTWAAMDQIRQLHESDPETWTPLKFSQCFPISEQGARRFLGSKRPKKFTPAQIREHDAAVEKRWQQIAKGNAEENGEDDVTDNVRLMVKTGLTKSMPLKTFTKLGGETEPEKIVINLDYSDQPSDGPFLKMYKSHVRWKQSMKSEKDEAKKTPSATTIDLHLKPEELLNSVLYSDFFGQSDQCKNRSDRPVRIDEFKADLRAKIKQSRNRFDRQHKKWSKE